MNEIHEMAVTGKSAIEAMGTRMQMPNRDDVLILGAQLDPMPLNGHNEVSLQTVIGKHAKLGEDVISPSKFPGIDSADDLKKLVDELRTRSEGRPVGIKIAAGRIEKDLAFCVYAEPDFITIDGRGGATGASPAIVRDSTSVPTIYALYRARKYLDSVNADIDLVITGGLRVSSDFAKAIAMGAAAKRVENYLRCSAEELKTFARITGHRDIHGLSVDDLCTISREYRSTPISRTHEAHNESCGPQTSAWHSP